VSRSNHKLPPVAWQNSKNCWSQTNRHVRDDPGSMGRLYLRNPKATSRCSPRDRDRRSRCSRKPHGTGGAQSPETAGSPAALSTRCFRSCRACAGSSTGVAWNSVLGFLLREGQGQQTPERKLIRCDRPDGQVTRSSPWPNAPSIAVSVRLSRGPSGSATTQPRQAEHRACSTSDNWARPLPTCSQVAGLREDSWTLHRAGGGRRLRGTGSFISGEYTAHPAAFV